MKLVTTSAILVLFLTTTVSAEFKFGISNSSSSTRSVKSGGAPDRPTIFSLARVGDSVTMGVLKLPSRQMKGTDEVALAFRFNQNKESGDFFGNISPLVSTGNTRKGGGMLGKIAGGKITWSNARSSMKFGQKSDGILDIEMMDSESEELQAMFTLRQAPEPIDAERPQAVPEPGAIVIWSLLAAIGAVYVVRKKKMAS